MKKSKKSLSLLLCVGLTSACGQQSPAPSSHATPPVQSSATQKKGGIAQPAVKPGKALAESSLLITFHGCADLVLSDGRGRKLGYDPGARKSYQQIPGGIYDEGDPISAPEDEGTPAKPETKTSTKKQDCTADKTLQLPQPQAGIYNLRVHNPTGDPFKLQLTSYRDSTENGRFALSQIAGKPSAFLYQFQLPPSPESPLDVKTIPPAVQPPVR